MRERAAFVALGVLTVVTLGVVVSVQLIGDQRQVTVLSTFPEDRGETSVRLTDVTVTFDRPVDEQAVESRLTLLPALEFTPAWQGNTLRLTLAAAPSAATYELTIGSGPIGRHSENLVSDFVTSFTVRTPGLLLVRSDGTSSTIVESRPEAERTLFAGQRVTEVAVSPDGRQVAAVHADDRSLVTALIDVSSGEVTGQLGGASGSVAQPAWGPSNLLAAVHNEQLPTGDVGAGRVWFVRTSGELISEADPSGEPTLGPSWSPDGQWLLFSAPTSAELRLRNMATSEVRAVGVPRAASFSWSPSSRLYAFEAALRQEGDGALRQPVTVQSVDSTYEATFGELGEVMLQPVFIDDDTLAVARLTLGESRHLEVALFSLAQRAEIAVFPIPGEGFIRSIEPHPTERRLLVVLLEGLQGAALELDLDSGVLAVAAENVSAATWLP